MIKIYRKNSINLINKTKNTDNDGDEDQLNFSILGVRDIEATDNSNFFTQFSLMNQEINSSGRIIGNIGLGYRKLSEDKKAMTPYFTTKKKGTGLGLPIVTKIINEHSGNFSIKN